MDKLTIKNFIDEGRKIDWMRIDMFKQALSYIENKEIVLSTRKYFAWNLLDSVKNAKCFNNFDHELLDLIRVDAERIKHAIESGDIISAENQCKILKEFLEG